MKLILRFLKPHWKLCLVTVLLLIVDVVGALIIPALASEMMKQGGAGVDFQALLTTAIAMAVAAVISGAGGRFRPRSPRSAQLLRGAGRHHFSGGQKQRLSIARALVKKPELYIFDDSFSALDFKTDAALRKALVAKTRDAAVMIIAQRVSTILHAEQIIVLHEGEPVGIGTHEQLLENCTVYREIYESQTKEAQERHG